MRFLIATILVAILAGCGGSARSAPPPNPKNYTGTPILLAQLGGSAAIPSHIPTWAYDEYHAKGDTASAAQVRQYLSFAEGGLGNTKAVDDCAGSSACYSVWYLDTNKIYDSRVCPDPAYAPFVSASSEDWFVHEGGFTGPAHRVQGRYAVSCKNGSESEPVYVANNANPGVQAYFRRYLQSNANAWDYFMMDDVDGTVADQMYGPGGGFCDGSECRTTEEFRNDDAVAQSHVAMADALDHADGSPMRFFYNGLSFDGAPNANDIGILGASRRFVGAVCENCIVSGNALQTANYVRVLNAMATIDNLTDGTFVLLSTGDAPAGSDAQITQRLVTTAVVWLGFSDGHTIVWPDLEDNTHNLAVWPEDQIYPTKPLQRLREGAADLQVAPGVWRREFSACYRNRSPIGGCAALLNANGSPVAVQPSWLDGSYRHAVAIEGGDILGGGSLSLASFAPGSASIPAGGALLLAF